MVGHFHPNVCGHLKIVALLRTAHQSHLTDQEELQYQVQPLASGGHCACVSIKGDTILVGEPRSNCSSENRLNRS